MHAHFLPRRTKSTQCLSVSKDTAGPGLRPPEPKAPPWEVRADERLRKTCSTRAPRLPHGDSAHGPQPGLPKRGAGVAQLPQWVERDEETSLAGIQREGLEIASTSECNPVFRASHRESKVHVGGKPTPV